MNDILRVNDAIWVKDFIFYVELSNGKKGVVNFAPLAERFEAFKQIIADDKQEYYAIENNHTIQWYNGADIAPEWINDNLYS